jgi:cytochrome P450
MTGKYLVTGDPHVVRDLFSTDPQLLLPAGAQSLAPLMGNESLFLLQPSEHGRERKLLLPPFHGSRMRAYETTIADTVRRRSSAWRTGSVVRVLEQMRHVSAEVIVRAVFGVQDRARVEQYLVAVARWVDAWKPVFILVPFTQRELFGLSPWASFVRASQELDRMLDQDVAERRASGQRSDDILSLLLDSSYDDGTPISDQRIRAHLRSLLFAGHETTMIAIAWVMHHLHSSPEALDRTRDELHADPEAVLDNAWFDAVVQEALRPKPLIIGIARQPAQDLELGGFDVPAGTPVYVSIAMLNSDPELYPDPYHFRPERFLTRRPKPWEFAPFGGGARRCLGAAFATLECKVVVATLLSRFCFERTGPREAETARRNISMAPKAGVPLRVTQRLTAH